MLGDTHSNMEFGLFIELRLSTDIFFCFFPQLAYKAACFITAFSYLLHSCGTCSFTPLSPNGPLLPRLPSFSFPVTCVLLPSVSSSCKISPSYDPLCTFMTYHTHTHTHAYMLTHMPAHKSRIYT